MNLHSHLLITPGSTSSRFALASCLAVVALATKPALRAGTLVPPANENSYYSRGRAVATSGGTALVASDPNTNVLGSAVYLYQGVDTTTGAVAQSARLTSVDGQAGSAGGNFGTSLGLSGGLGIVGAPSFTSNSGYVPKVYVYNNLATATGTVTESAQLRPSDAPSATSLFGGTVSLAGTTGLVGAYRAGLNSGNTTYIGAAYLYRNLNTASGTVTENVKLTPSDGALGANANGGQFGYSVSLSGNTGLVGANFAATNGNANRGAAYVYRNLNTASGTVTENVKLTASDGAAQDYFGYAVSQSGNTALVGAYRATATSTSAFGPGAAYVYRNLDTASGTVPQSVKLTASDTVSGSSTTASAFGFSVALSGNTALVGTPGTASSSNTGITNQGAAYLFRNLDTASGTVTQNVKLFASDGAVGDRFGYAVSVDGDRFVIGAPQFQTSQVGKSYSGSLGSVSTLDLGNTAAIISGISFNSQDDWVVGQNTSGNQVTLSAGDTATVNAAGRGIFIGQNAGSNNNRLIIAGTVNASTVTIGDAAGTNTGNTLQLGNGGTTGSLPTGTTINNHGTLAFNRSNAVTQGTDFSGAALTGRGGITQLGTGTTTLTAANTYTGATRVQAGRLIVAARGTLLSTSSVEVRAVGSLVISASDSINSAAPLTLDTASATATALGTSGFSQTFAGFTLSSTSVIDLGNGASLLQLGNSALNAWTGILNIFNYSGTAILGNGIDQLSFGSDTTGLTLAQLASIRFYSDAGATMLGTAGYATPTGGEVVPGGLFAPVPEPSTYAMLLGGAGVLGFMTLRKRRSSQA